MTEQERILKMVDEGKLSQREAAELLAALSDLEETQEQLGEAQAEIHAETDKAQTANEAEETTESDSAESFTDDLPDGFRWVKLNLLAGDIDVQVDSSLDAPVIDDGNAQVEQVGQDYVVRGRTNHGLKDKIKNKVKNKVKGKDGLNDFLEGMGDWVAGLTSRVGDLDVRVPEGYGVYIQSKAGDVDVRGVAFLKAELMAGDVDVRDVGGIDIVASAGDIDIEFKPTAGKHRIQATAGDVDVNLQAGSSVAVTARVSMGEIDMSRRDGGVVERSGGSIGGSASTVVGAGEASLDITLSAGDLDVTIRD